MKLEMSKEQCLRMAEREGNHEVGAGFETIPAQAITFWYRNYKGEEGYRRVKPISIRYGTSDWHKEPQWLLLADDLENNKRREFAMRDMSGVVGKPTIWVQGIT